MVTWNTGRLCLSMCQWQLKRWLAVVTCVHVSYELRLCALSNRATCATRLTDLTDTSKCLVEAVILSIFSLHSPVTRANTSSRWIYTHARLLSSYTRLGQFGKSQLCKSYGQHTIWIVWHMSHVHAHVKQSFRAYYVWLFIWTRWWYTHTFIIYRTNIHIL